MHCGLERTIDEGMLPGRRGQDWPALRKIHDNKNIFGMKMHKTGKNFVFSSDYDDFTAFYVFVKIDVDSLCMDAMWILFTCFIGNVHGGGCKILPSRVSLGTWPLAWVRNYLPRSKTREVYRFPPYNIKTMILWYLKHFIPVVNVKK